MAGLADDGSQPGTRVRGDISAHHSVGRAPRPEVLKVPETEPHLRPLDEQEAESATGPADEPPKIEKPAERYRVRPPDHESGEHWNPYAAENRFENKVRQARQRAHPGKRLEYDRWQIGDKATAPNHYQILGVPPTSTQEQIERAYRRYVADIHPDKFFDNPERRKEAEERLRHLNKIMQTLRDPVRRANYDAGL